MNNSDRRIELLYRLKQLSEEGQWSELIIPERVLDSNSLLLHE
jgi:hypothetical protein